MRLGDLEARGADRAPNALCGLVRAQVGLAHDVHPGKAPGGGRLDREGQGLYAAQGA